MFAPRIAFLILAHQDAPQLDRLCRRLNGYSVFVHMDQRATSFPVSEISRLPNVTAITPRRDVYWGDYSIIEVELALLRAALQQQYIDRFVLLSGSCYPVKPMTVLEAAFRSHPEREWISVTPLTKQSKLYNTIGRRWRMVPLTSHTKLDVRMRSISNKVSKILGRNFQREIGMQPYFGSQWWGLTRPCVTKILESIDSNPTLAQAYRTVYAPDEHLIQTIVANSEFSRFAIHVEDCGVHTNQLTPLHLISPSNDRYFRSTDSDFELVAETDKFFIRKVSSVHSTDLLDRIDRELLSAV